MTESRHVMVVDDEQIIADSLAEILRVRGFKVTACYDGDQALKRASVHAPDILLSDVIMPGISGTELALQISKMFPSCRIVLYSSLAVISNLFPNREEPAFPCKVLAKPLHPDELIASLAE